MMQARPYEGLQDLYAMLDLLAEGRKADNGTYYIHVGDLQWWLFYTDLLPQTWQSNIRLWMQDGRLVGWALLSPDQDAFDVFADPRLRGDVREHEMFAWAVEQMSAHDVVQNVWVAEDDEARIHWLEGHGFACADSHTILFKRALSGALDVPPLPEGFSIRTSRGEEDAQLRSVASHAAFGARKPFEEYWPRTLRFMQSPVYVPQHEIFINAPEGDVASYCIVWTDKLNKAGHFEPVGTHPNFQRRGLGKILLFESLRRLKSEGMSEASVCTNHDNEAAIRLYESVGFQKAKRLLTFRKGNTL
jgi:mycothiol synthase